VAAGLTLVEPLAEVEVNVPGVMAMLVAPETDQLSVLLEPAAMLAGLAVKELMAGLPCAGVTVTVSVEVTEPAVLLAVSVYVVVAAGLTLIEPLAAVDVNVPGAIAMLVAPETDQLRVLLDPEAMPEGLAAKEPICGAEFCCGGVVCEVAEPAQPARATQQTSAQTSTQTANARETAPREPGLPLRNGAGEFMAPPFVLASPV